MRHNYINTSKALNAVKYTYRNSRLLHNREKTRYVNTVKAAIMTLRPYMWRGEANEYLTDAIVHAAFSTVEKILDIKYQSIEIGRDNNE